MENLREVINGIEYVEEWKDVEFYETSYMVSSFGRIKSLDRIVYRLNKFAIKRKGKILKPNINPGGYKMVLLYKNGKSSAKSVHSVVAAAFLNHKPCGWVFVINHIDHDRLNNSLLNLEIVTNRKNLDMQHIDSESEYVGVSRVDKSRKYRSRVGIDNKSIYLGSFVNEEDAAQAYICYCAIHNLK